jgi:hypothetical protein
LWKDFTIDNIEDLNEYVNDEKLRKQLFVIGKERWWSKFNWWPLWVDKSVTILDWNLKDYIQVVWHSRVPFILDKEFIIYTDNIVSWAWEILQLDI